MCILCVTVKQLLHRDKDTGKSLFCLLEYILFKSSHIGCFPRFKKSFSLKLQTSQNFIFLIIYKFFLNLLNKNIKGEIARRILSKNKEKWQTVNMAYTEIDYLRDQASNRDDEEELKKLDEINKFIMSIEKKYEIA